MRAFPPELPVNDAVQEAANAVMNELNEQIAPQLMNHDARLLFAGYLNVSAGIAAKLLAANMYDAGQIAHQFTAALVDAITVPVERPAIVSNADAPRKPQ